MSALKVAGVDRPPTHHPVDDATRLMPEDISQTPRIKAALSTLREAARHAQDLGAGAWEFAVEIASLRRLELSNNDLRWLLLRGLAKHGSETTQPNDPARSFRHTKQPRFTEGSCFVFTSAGLQLADQLLPEREPCEQNGAMSPVEGSERHRIKTERPRTPTWDRNRLELRVGSVVIKRYTIPSIDQESVLAALEEAHWPACIDDPLPHKGNASRQARLQEALDRLNRSQKRPLLVFSSDNGGQTVRWQFHDAVADEQ